MLVFVALPAGIAGAAQASRCSSAKFKAAGKKTAAKANCFSQAVLRGTPVSSSCIKKAELKFASAFNKAERSSDCLAPTGDASNVEGKVDVCIIRITNDVNESSPGPSMCDALKIRAAGKKVSAKANCVAKAVATGVAVSASCLGKAESKFGRAISKAEGGTACTHTGQTASIEMVVDMCMSDLSDALEPPPTTTTTSTTTTTLASATTTSNPSASSTTTTNTSDTTTTTSTTLLPPCPAALPAGTLTFTIGAGTTSCGSAGLTSPPPPPVSGEVDNLDSSKRSDLGLGCLYFGGGNANAFPPAGLPDGAKSVLGIAGVSGDLLAPTLAVTGSPGSGKTDCTLGAGPGRHCVNGNLGTDGMGACTSDGDCGNPLILGACDLDANCYFGPPTPVPGPGSGGLSVCLLDVIAHDICGSSSLTTLQTTLSAALSSRIYVTGNRMSPCPQCVSGACSYGERAGMPCTGGVGSKNTTLECPPTVAKFTGRLGITLSPLTSGTSTLTDATGSFCPGQMNPGAFGGEAGTIRETGSPMALTGLLQFSTALAGSFCVPATGSVAIDAFGDLPGPGAVSIPGTVNVTLP